MTTAILALEFRLGKWQHATRRAWCLLTHDDVRETNQPPQRVCVCGMWRTPGEETSMRRTALTLVLVTWVAAMALLSIACGDVLTAPSHNDPVIVDDGGLHASGGDYNYGGGG